MIRYEVDNQTTMIEYDQPSTLFGQFNNSEVTAVARSLDVKLAGLINKVELMPRCRNIGKDIQDMGIIL